MKNFPTHLFLFIFVLVSCDQKVEIESTIPQKVQKQTSLVKVVVAVTDSCQQPITFEGGGGLSVDLVEALNTVQQKYYFEHLVLPTKRLELLGKEGKVHIAAFQNINWGWGNENVERTYLMDHSKDVFIALKEKARNQTYFENIDKLHKIGVAGFHYSFINLTSADENSTGKDNIKFVNSEKAVLEMILNKRGEIGIVSTMTLKYLADINPNKFNKLLISERFDTEYDRYYVVLQTSPINSKELNKFLKELKDKGTLKGIYSKYGLLEPVLE